MPVNRWWDKSDAEIFWLEITGRPDLGADLKAPQQDETGDDYWSYSLINEIGDGNIVFHYDRARLEIVAWSRAAGQAWDEDIVWAARGASAQRTLTIPHLRAGWKLGLTDHERLDEPVTLDHVRAKRTQVLDLEDRLTRAYGDPVYMPFVRYGSTMRAQQGYLTKMPAELVSMFPPLEAAAQRAKETAPTPEDPAPATRKRPTSRGFGATYRAANEQVSVSQRDPMIIDPALVERGTQGHATAQNRIAEAARRSGYKPRSPAPGEPNYDVAWQAGSDCVVVEVKSITDENEERQLRLGLGQVLRYTSLLRRGGQVVVRGILMAERAPSDPSWLDLCSDLGIELFWPERLNEV